tara:strand:+ start:1583 stop:1945 length:363 start_codon:yes stop_codon:yes gene_type:complete
MSRKDEPRTFHTKKGKKVSTNLNQHSETFKRNLGILETKLPHYGTDSPRVSINDFQKLWTGINDILNELMILNDLDVMYNPSLMLMTIRHKSLIFKLVEDELCELEYAEHLEREAMESQA